MSSYGYGYGYSSYGYGYDYGSGYEYDGSAYSYAPPYGHGSYAGYGIRSPHTAGLFITTLGVGESESFDRQFGYTSSSVYAVRNVDGTSYGRYSTYNSATGLYHVDTAYGHPTPYSGYGYSTYYARHSDGYSFFEQNTTYDYHPGAGYSGYAIDREFRLYSYADGSSLGIFDYFRSESSHAYGGSSTVIDQNEAQTRTDAYGYSTYSYSSYQHTLSF